MLHNDPKSHSCKSRCESLRSYALDEHARERSRSFPSLILLTKVERDVVPKRIILTACTLVRLLGLLGRPRHAPLGIAPDAHTRVLFIYY